MPGFPEVAILSNEKVDGKFIGVVAAGDFWHSDQSYRRETSLATLLYAHKLPRKVGHLFQGYVLMSNHVHLLLETKSVPLSKIMQGIQLATPKDTTGAIARSAICFKAVTKRYCAIEMRICLNWCAIFISIPDG